MRTATLLLLLALLAPPAAATYWNHTGVAIGFEGGSVQVYRADCAGHGTPAPLVVVTSVPDPVRDCRPQSRIYPLP